MVLNKLIIGIGIIMLAIVLFYGSIIGFYGLIAFFSPSMPPAYEIREQLLIETPIGSTEEEVRVFIAGQEDWVDWSDFMINNEWGDRVSDDQDDILIREFLEMESLRHDVSHLDALEEGVRMEIRLRMESKVENWHSSAQSFGYWRFDENGILVDVVTRIRVHSHWH